MLLTVAAIIAGALGYVFQILMGRLLPDEEFAVFSALNALSMVFGSPLAALVMLIARRVASLQAAGEEGALPAMYRFWQTRVVAVCLVLAGLLAWGMPVVQGFVKTTDVIALWLFFGIVALNALVVVNLAFFQGLHRFGWLSGLAILIVIVKIASSVSLIVVADWGVRGALAGMLIAAGLTWAFGRGILRRDFANVEPPTETRPHGFPWVEAGPVLSATVGFAVLSQLDVPLANRFFEPSVASAYAAAAVLGKAVLYIPGGLVMALFPMVAANETNEQQRSFSGVLLRQSLLVTLILCGAAAFVYSLAAEPLIHAVYGLRYPQAAGILRLYGWAMVPLSMALVLKHFFIASSTVGYSWLVGIAALLLVLLVVTRHPLPGEILLIVALISCVLCGAALWIHTYSRCAASS